MIFQLLIIGLSIGILIGLSNSPVISNIIISIISAFIVILTTIFSLKIKFKKEIVLEFIVNDETKKTPTFVWIFAILCPSLLLGSISGLYIKNYSLLEPPICKIITEYSNEYLPENKIKTYLFYKRYYDNYSTTTSISKKQENSIIGSWLQNGEMQQSAFCSRMKLLLTSDNDSAKLFHALSEYTIADTFLITKPTLSEMTEFIYNHCKK